MGLEFLSLPIFILVFIFISSILLYISFKRREKDKISLILLYLTISFGAIISAVISFIKDKELYIKYFENIGNLLIGIIFIILIELFYISITYKSNKDSKK